MVLPRKDVFYLLFFLPNSLLPALRVSSRLRKASETMGRALAFGERSFFGAMIFVFLDMFYI